MTEALTRGWCPSAHRPMPSGDGLIVRVKPPMARLQPDQVQVLTSAARRYGDGFLSLTNRANIQIRAVSAADYPSLLEMLQQAGLVSLDGKTEARRNIVVDPFWRPGDRTNRIVSAVSERLGELPALPDKFGFAVDLGSARRLDSVSGDIRFERSRNGDIVVRADGSPTGRIVAEADAIDAALSLATWFAANGGLIAGRMVKLLKLIALPPEWTGSQPLPSTARPGVGRTSIGMLLGAPFGEAPADALQSLFTASGARALRITPWRTFLLEGADAAATDAFIQAPDDPLLTIIACPGAPRCATATVETQSVARRLAAAGVRHAHVSGCGKGCAKSAATATTLVGRDGGYDLVRNGAPDDEPLLSGLSAETAIAEAARA